MRRRESEPSEPGPVRVRRVLGEVDTMPPVEC